jgi:hypothetical protein
MSLYRHLVAIACVAAISGYLAGCDGGRGDSGSLAGMWVRTVDGWERFAAPENRFASIPPQLHPATLASGQLLASTLALLVFPSCRRADALPGQVAGRCRSASG